MHNVKWVIQGNSILEEEKQNKLLAALSMYDIDYQIVTCIPFDTGPIFVENNERKRLIPYGSANFIERCIKQKEFFVWAGKEFLDLENQYLLNTHSQKMTVTQLLDICDNLEDKPYFIKPYDQFKPFAGQVMLPSEMRSLFVQLTGQTLNKNQVIQIFECKNIRSEYRFFVINYKVITGSLYRHMGKLQSHNEQTKDSLEIKKGTRMFTLAQDLVDMGNMPGPCFVMDIARTDYSDTAKIIEFNVMNCSGFYSSNVEKIVISVSNFVSHNVV